MTDPQQIDREEPCLKSLRMEVIAMADALRSTSILSKWEEWLSRIEGIDPLEGSPIWMRHQTAANDNLHLVKLYGVAESGVETCVGVCPIKTGRITLLYDIASRPIYRDRLPSVSLMGSQPLIPRSTYVLNAFIRDIFRLFPQQQCIYIERLPIDSRLWADLLKLSRQRGAFLLHIPYGRRPWHLLEVQDSFEGYLGTLKAKTRSTLKRKLRQYERITGKPAILRRYESSVEVEEFLRLASQVSAESWQKHVAGIGISNDQDRRKQLIMLASQSLVRCYILFCGDEAHAFLLGYQHQGTYHFVQTGFRQSLDHLSPGTVLLYRVIHDLHEYNRPKQMDFGMGDGVHKRRFANRTREDSTVILLRPTLVNRLRSATHVAFLVSVEIVKKLLGRNVTK